MNINQLEIWEIEFSPNVGSEIGKRRPGVVVSSDNIGRLPLKTVLPITNWSQSFSRYPWMIKIIPDTTNGLSKDSAIDCFQIRNFSTKRFIKKIGNIDKSSFSQIKETILKTIT